MQSLMSELDDRLAAYETMVNLESSENNANLNPLKHSGSSPTYDLDLIGHTNNEITKAVVNESISNNNDTNAAAIAAIGPSNVTNGSSSDQDQGPTVKKRMRSTPMAFDEEILDFRDGMDSVERSYLRQINTVNQKLNQNFDFNESRGRQLESERLIKLAETRSLTPQSRKLASSFIADDDFEYHQQTGYESINKSTGLNHGNSKFRRVNKNSNTDPRVQRTKNNQQQNLWQQQQYQYSQTSLLRSESSDVIKKSLHQDFDDFTDNNDKDKGDTNFVSEHDIISRYLNRAEHRRHPKIPQSSSYLQKDTRLMEENDMVEKWGKRVDKIASQKTRRQQTEPKSQSKSTKLNNVNSNPQRQRARTNSARRRNANTNTHSSSSSSSQSSSTNGISSQHKQGGKLKPKQQNQNKFITPRAVSLDRLTGLTQSSIQRKKEIQRNRKSMENRWAEHRRKDCGKKKKSKSDTNEANTKNTNDIELTLTSKSTDQNRSKTSSNSEVTTDLSSSTTKPRTKNNNKNKTQAQGLTDFSTSVRSRLAANLSRNLDKLGSMDDADDDDDDLHLNLKESESSPEFTGDEQYKSKTIDNVLKDVDDLLKNQQLILQQSQNLKSDQSDEDVNLDIVKEGNKILIKNNDNIDNDININKINKILNDDDLNYSASPSPVLKNDGSEILNYSSSPSPLKIVGEDLLDQRLRSKSITRENSVSQQQDQQQEQYYQYDDLNLSPSPELNNSDSDIKSPSIIEAVHGEESLIGHSILLKSPPVTSQTSQQTQIQSQSQGQQFQMQTQGYEQTQDNYDNQQQQNNQQQSFVRKLPHYTEYLRTSPGSSPLKNSSISPVQQRVKNPNNQYINSKTQSCNSQANSYNSNHNRNSANSTAKSVVTNSKQQNLNKPNRPRTKVQNKFEEKLKNTLDEEDLAQPDVDRQESRQQNQYHDRTKTKQDKSSTTSESGHNVTGKNVKTSNNTEVIPVYDQLAASRRERQAKPWPGCTQNDQESMNHDIDDEIGKMSLSMLNSLNSNSNFNDNQENSHSVRSERDRLESIIHESCKGQLSLDTRDKGQDLFNCSARLKNVKNVLNQSLSEVLKVEQVQDQQDQDQQSQKFEEENQIQETGIQQKPKESHPDSAKDSEDHDDDITLPAEQLLNEIKFLDSYNKESNREKSTAKGNSYRVNGSGSASADKRTLRDRISLAHAPSPGSPPINRLPSRGQRQSKSTKSNSKLSSKSQYLEEFPGPEDLDDYDMDQYNLSFQNNDQDHDEEDDILVLSSRSQRLNDSNQLGANSHNNSISVRSNRNCNQRQMNQGKGTHQSSSSTYQLSPLRSSAPPAPRNTRRRPYSVPRDASTIGLPLHDRKSQQQKQQYQLQSQKSQKSSKGPVSPTLFYDQDSPEHRESQIGDYEKDITAVEFSKRGKFLGQIPASPRQLQQGKGDSSSSSITKLNGSQSQSGTSKCSSVSNPIQKGKGKNSTKNPILVTPNKNVRSGQNTNSTTQNKSINKVPPSNSQSSQQQQYDYKPGTRRLASISTTHTNNSKTSTAGSSHGGSNRGDKSSNITNNVTYQSSSNNNIKMNSYGNTKGINNMQRNGSKNTKNNSTNLGNSLRTGQNSNSSNSNLKRSKVNLLTRNDVKSGISLSSTVSVVQNKSIKSSGYGPRLSTTNTNNNYSTRNGGRNINNNHGGAGPLAIPSTINSNSARLNNKANLQNSYTARETQKRVHTMSTRQPYQPPRQETFARFQRSIARTLDQERNMNNNRPNWNGFQTDLTQYKADINSITMNNHNLNQGRVRARSHNPNPGQRQRYNINNTRTRGGHGVRGIELLGGVVGSPQAIQVESNRIMEKANLLNSNLPKSMFNDDNKNGTVAAATLNVNDKSGSGKNNLNDALTSTSSPISRARIVRDRLKQDLEIESGTLDLGFVMAPRKQSSSSISVQKISQGINPGPLYHGNKNSNYNPGTELSITNYRRAVKLNEESDRIQNLQNQTESQCHDSDAGMVEEELPGVNLGLDLAEEIEREQNLNITTTVTQGCNNMSTTETLTDPVRTDVNINNNNNSETIEDIEPTIPRAPTAVPASSPDRLMREVRKTYGTLNLSDVVNAQIQYLN